MNEEIEPMDLETHEREIIAKNPEKVFEVAKAIFAHNASAVNDHMRVSNAENSIRAAALFVEVWNKI